jgi:hypothetical protein
LLLAEIFSEQQILMHANGAPDLPPHAIQTSQGQIGFNPFGVAAHRPDESLFGSIQVLIENGKKRGTHL